MTEGATNDVHTQIDEWVNANKIMLFMKGTPSFPMCGFSARVIDILKQCDVPFQAVNVLADNRVREGVKTYSNWPTIPQLYVDGQLVGGCDITVQMHSAGELEPLLKKATATAETVEA